MLLESLACGTRVIATNVGGIPEIVSDERAGVLLDERSSAGLIDAYRRLTSAPIDASATRLFAERFGWAARIATLEALLERVKANGSSRGSAARAVGP